MQLLSAYTPCFPFELRANPDAVGSNAYQAHA